MTSKKEIGSSLTTVASFFTISLPFLYVLGFAYESGYLAGYGVNSELFPRSIPEYLTTSLIFVLNAFVVSNKGLFFAFILTFLCFVLIAICILIINKIFEFAFKKINIFKLNFEQHALKLKENLNGYNVKVLEQPVKFTLGIFLFYI